MQQCDFSQEKNNKLFSLTNIHEVPKIYTDKVNRLWWKYTISTYFPAYKPTEIEEWPVEDILEHLAACSIIRKQEEEGGGK